MALRLERQISNLKVDYELYPAIISHRLRTDVTMTSRSAPVFTAHRFGVEGDADAEILGDTVEKIARDAHFVGCFDTGGGSGAEFPLGRHRFAVDCADVEPGVEAGLVFDKINKYKPTL